MGWRERSDAPDFPVDAGTSEDEWDSVANPRRPRKTITFWARGNRYVRLCAVDTKDDDKLRFALHYGDLDNLDSDFIYQRDEEGECLISGAKVLMRMGGRP